MYNVTNCIEYVIGFGEHPHADMEICTYVINGYLTHKDSMGTAETLTRGDIQFMVRTIIFIIIILIIIVIILYLLV